MNDAAWKSLCFFESTLTPKIMTFVRRLMLLAVFVGLTPGASAYAESGCTGKAAGLLDYAGTYRSAQLLDETTVAAALHRLLGPELARLRRNLAVAGPVDLVSCNLVVAGNAEHAGGDENAIVAVNVASGGVAAAILSRGRISIYADTAGFPAGMEYAAVPLAVKDWLAVVYTKFYFRSHPPVAARLVPPH